jgi:short subunit fatty acids transporter
MLLYLSTISGLGDAWSSGGNAEVNVTVKTRVRQGVVGDDPIVELADKESAQEARESSETTAPDEDVPRADSPVARGGSPEERAADASPSPAERIDGTRLLTLALGAALVFYLIVYFAQESFALTLDIVTWSFLAAILLLAIAGLTVRDIMGYTTITHH